MNKFLEKLNPMQREAAQNVDGPLLVLAGAGSGKTRVLTYRIAHMIAEVGISPWSILAITFTNKAAKEMAQRIENLIGDIAEDMWIRTFHSACVRILRRDIERIGYKNNFNIIDSDDQKTIIKECIRELDFDEKDFPPRSVISEISSAKDKLIDPIEYKNQAADYRQQQIARIYSLYSQKLKNANDLDFDDLIMLTVKLFQSAPDVLEFYRHKFRYILVDEYQDTNKAQNVLITLLAEKHRNLCVVGDDDQSIYKFRGADISNILDFEKAFPDAKIIRLEQNYRSTQNILDAANNVIKNNGGRKGKNLWTDAGSGDLISVYKAESDFAEADFIAEQIEQMCRDGYKYSDFAVLYRANSSSRVLEEVFMRKALPYRVLAGLRFYDRKEIRDMVAYLKLIKNNDDDISLKRIINVPARKIGKVTLNKIEAVAGRENTSILQAIGNNANNLGNNVVEFYNLISELSQKAREMPVHELIEEVFEKSGYAKLLENDEKGEEREENIGQLISGAVNFEETFEDATFEDYMDNLALVSDIDNYDEELDAVVLMTIHGAKGLEFPVVFICGFDEGIFPNSICMYDVGELEEERRLCYVGITRAKEKLFLTSAYTRMVYGKTAPYTSSRFLDEIPSNILDIKDSKDDIKSFDFTDKPSYELPRNSLLDFEKEKHRANIEIFNPGESVVHKKFGKGIVISATPIGNDIHYEIAFDSVGTKNLLGLYAKLRRE